MSSEQYDPTELLRIKSIRELAKLVPRVLRFSWQASPALICLVGAMAFLSALIEPAILFVTKLVVDSVHQSQGLGVNWALITVPLGVVFALWIGRTLLGGVNGILHELLRHRIDNTTSEKLLRKSATLDVAFFEAPKFYDQLQQAVMQQLSVQQMPGSLYALLQQLVALGAMAGLLSLLHPLAFLILVATVLPQFFFESHMAKLEFQLGSELARNWRHTNYMESLLTEREKAKEIRIFGLGNVFLDRFLKYRREYITAHFRQMLRFMGYNLGLRSLSTIGVGVVSVYAVVQAARGQISLGTLTMVFAAAQEIVEYVRRLISSLSGTYQVSLQASRYFDLLDLDPNSIAGSLELPRSLSPIVFPNSLHSGIALENVSFSYPATDKPVLKDVSFSIPAGSKVAIVGENGAGKTTLVKLLARFYDPVGGTIYLDGRDYRDYELSSLRANVSVVFQDFVKYDISASENIGVGRIEAVEDRSQIVQAARNASAHRMVSKLPHGYDTVLGRTMDEGVDLSGGEWQHISIARAFMSDTPILILDEPTAALDSLRERELYERIAQLAKDKTVVFISHRFSTVRMADTIVVIDDGNSIEVGSHEELLDRRGKYYRMFETQARHYR